MNSTHCQQCGAALPEGLLLGLCPRCVARQAAGILAARSGASSPTEPPRLRYFGDYELLEEIARGGMGVVWKARQVSLNRTVAVKMLLGGKFSSPEFVQRFRAEAEAAANLQHPNIVAIHEVGEHEGQPYFSMDYVEGPNLAQRARDQPLPARLAATCLRTIAEAVHYAHQRGVIHRDLKPSNVVLDTHGQPRVTDFGLAKFVVPASGGSGAHEPAQAGTTNANDLTLTGQVLGTPGFMPPEQAGGRRGAVTAASDIYSLGAILYFLLTGRAPFAAGSLEETLHQVIEVEPVAPRLLNPSVPRDLETICLKCLAKEPPQRYATAQELAAELGRFVGGEPIRARPVSAPEKLWRWCRRKPASAALTALAMTLCLIGAAAVTWQWGRAESANRATQKVNAQLRDAMQRMELQKAEELFERDDAPTALAHLARVLRNHPTPRAVAERLVAALSHRSFPGALRELSPSSGDAPVLQMSSEGRWLLLGGTNDTAEIWDTQSDSRHASLGEGSAGCSASEFSPDGRFLATVHPASSKITNWVVRLWNLDGTPLIPPLPHPGEVEVVRFSPDGQLFVTGSLTNHARIWETRTGRLLAELPSGVGGDQGGHPLEFSPDSQRVLTANEDRFETNQWQGLEIWDARTGRSLFKLPTLHGGASWAHFSPDGAKIAAGSREDMRLYDAQSGQLLFSIPHNDSISDAQFSPDGGRLVTVGDFKRTARVWDVRTGRPSGEPLPHDYYVIQARFTPDGLSVITLGESGLRVWDPETGRPRTEHIPQEGRQWRISRDGRQVLTSWLRWWDITPGQALPEPFGWTWTARFSPTGERLVAFHSSELLAFDAHSGQPLFSRDAENEITNSTFSSAEFSPDGGLLLTTFDHSLKLRVWNARTGAPVTDLIDAGTEPAPGPSGNEPPGAGDRGQRTEMLAHFSADGRRVITLSGEAVKFWESGTGEKVGEWRNPLLLRRSPSLYSRPLFSPDRRRVAVPGAVLDLETGRVLWQDASTKDRLADPACFSRDGRQLAVIDYSDVMVRATETGRELVARRWHGSTVKSAAFSPDGAKLLTASEERVVRLWDIRTGPLLLPSGLALREFAHTREAILARFTPDGSRVITVTTDDRSHLWDTASGHALADPFPDFSDFSPDGQRMLTGAESGLSFLDAPSNGVKLWEIPRLPSSVPAWLPALAEAVAGKGFGFGGVTEIHRASELDKLREEINRSTATDPYTRWGKWFFADRATRTMSAFTAKTVAEFIRDCLAAGWWTDGLIESVRQSPTNVLALEGLAQALETDAREAAESKRQPNHPGLVPAWFRQRAQEFRRRDLSP